MESESTCAVVAISLSPLRAGELRHVTLQRIAGRTILEDQLARQLNFSFRYFV